MSPPSQRNRREFVLAQYQQRVHQAEESTRHYFQSIVVLGAGITLAITALANEDTWKSQLATLLFGATPFFLVAWFGCFLFIYWEHHMMRVSLDSLELRTAKEMGESAVPPLYHEDLLGVFNQADFPPHGFPWPKKIRFKAVQWVFVLIALPFFLTFGFSAWETFHKIATSYNFFLAILYVCVALLALLIPILVHVNCVRRERRMKTALGIGTRWSGDCIDWIR